ncbi:MAG: hypothetical protein WCY89_08185 [Flavobacteriaceae bacterium]
MLTKIPVIALFFFTVFGFSQSTKLVFVDSVQIEADRYFGKDIFGYDYYSKNNVLYKHKKSEKWEYRDVFLGRIHSVDLINPLKILVFYKDNNFAVLLDNQLSEIEAFSFSESNVVAQTCTVASQNRFWIYDGLSGKLVLLDYFNAKKTPLNQPFDHDFLYYKSDYNFWYGISQEWKIYRYNNYGKMELFGEVPKFIKILMTDSGKIFFTSSGNLYLYEVHKNKTEYLFSFEEEIEEFDFKSGILTVFTGKTLKNYQLKLP